MATSPSVIRNVLVPFAGVALWLYVCRGDPNRAYRGAHIADDANAESDIRADPLEHRAPPRVAST